MAEATANIPFRVSVDKREQLKIEAAKRRTSVQGMIEDGLNLLMGSYSKSTAVKAVKDRDIVPAELVDIWNHPKDRVELHMRNAIAAYLKLPELKEPKPR